MAKFQPKCDRCRQPTLDLQQLYIGVVGDELTTTHEVPLAPMPMIGGTVEVCNDCYDEFETAISTWFKLAPERGRRVQRVKGVQ